MNTSLRYAAITFRPYPEVGEFVVVGIVAVDKYARVVVRLLQPDDTGRLTAFFPEIAPKVFSQTLEQLRVEFEAFSSGRDMGDSEVVFDEITASRGGMVQIKKRGVAIAADLDLWADDAFEKMVKRSAPLAEKASEACS